MQTTKMVTKRTILVVFLIGALYSTFHAMSGLNPKDITEWYISTKTSENFIPPKDLEKAHTILKDKKMEEDSPFVQSLHSQEAFRRMSVPELAVFPSHMVVATGYTAGVESTGKSPGDPGYGITYSGVHVRRALYSTIAADTSVFPIGTILFIPGYGYGVVADTGSAINGNKLDLYYSTVDDVYKHWGKRKLDVYVIEKGNGSLSETIMNQLNRLDYDNAKKIETIEV